MTETISTRGVSIAMEYAVLATEFSAASDRCKKEKSPHAATLAAAYAAFSAGCAAAAAAAEQVGASVPFPLLPLAGAVVPSSTIDIMTLGEVAAYLRLPEDAVREQAENGQLRGQQVRGEWRFVRAAIVAWLQTPQPVRKLVSAPSVSTTTAETEQEHESLMASIRAFRDEINRTTQSGKYTEE